jgi:hypothetical protein
MSITPKSVKAQNVAIAVRRSAGPARSMPLIDVAGLLAWRRLRRPAAIAI